MNAQQKFLFARTQLLACESELSSMQFWNDRAVATKFEGSPGWYNIDKIQAAPKKFGVLPIQLRLLFAKNAYEQRSV